MSESARKGEMDSVNKTASYWLVRLMASDCSPEERCAFEAWKEEDPAHEEAYLRLQRGGALFDRNLDDPQIQTLAERALSETEPAFWRRPRIQYAAIAASLIIAVGVALLMNAGMLFDRDPGETVVAGAEYYETAIGERSTITLPDGSVVTLNTNSRIDVDYSSAVREIRLIRGQGYFEVEKEVGRPFIVSAGGKRIVALGTAFDVRFDKADRVEVTLVKGLVDVTDATPRPAVGEGAVQPEAVAENIRLAPGERLIAKANAAPEIEKTDTVEETSWKTGKLIFRDRPLQSVIEEMNRYSVQQLVLADDDRLKEMRVSGAFNTGRATSFVSALEAMHPLEAMRSGQHELTLVWQE